jgi:SH3-like domain-containing protein
MPVTPSFDRGATPTRRFTAYRSQSRPRRTEGNAGLIGITCVGVSCCGGPGELGPNHSWAGICRLDRLPLEGNNVMVRRQQMFAAASSVSILALATAAFGAPGATPITETQNAAGQAPAVTADGRRPLAEIDGGNRRDEVVEVRVRAANVRVGPALDAPLITTVTQGCLLPMLGRNADWVRIGLDGDRAGWIHGPLVAAPIAGPEPAADRLGPLTGRQGKDSPGMVEVRVPHANVREGPATTTAVITTRQGGCLLPVLEWRDGWARIRLDGDGRTAWVQGALVAAVGAEKARAEAPALRQEMRRTSPSAPALSAPLRLEAPRLSVIESPPASEGRRGARLAAPATMAGGLHEQPNRSTPVVGQPESGIEAAEPGYAVGWIEAAAESPAATPSRVHRARAQSSSPVAIPARATALTAPPATAHLPSSTPDDSRGVVEAQAGETMRDDKFQRFRTTVEHVNERVRRAVGMGVFAKVLDLGGGAVALTATNAWLAAPEEAKRANLETLSRFWASVHEQGSSIVVRIVNDRGEVMMEERRSGGLALLSSADS